MSAFAFATCAPGLERFLKAEAAARQPGLRLAFSRPGLVTWKSDGEVPLDLALGAAFARVWGRSLGRATEPDEAAALAQGVLADEARPARLHVFSREPAALGGAAAQLDAWRGIAAALGDAVAAEPVARAGDLVIDVVVAPGEPLVVGAHRHAAPRSPQPGGIPAADVPADAPSRAYGKIEEAIAWADLDVRAGAVALEIGSAPGGAALALVRRGVEVWGVDTGAMDPVVLAARGPGGARVHHLAITLGALRWEQLPPRIDWLLVDVNLAPQVALHGVRRLMPRLKATLRGAVFTLKMNELAFVADLPALVERIREMGFGRVAVAHLPSNRQELCAVATMGGG